MIQFVRNDENGNITAKQDGATVAGIVHAGESRFEVSPAPGIALVDGVFTSLASAQEYVAEGIGESLPASTSAGKGKRSGSNANKSASNARAKRSSAPAKAEKKSAPASERKVSEVMQRNIAELSAGNYPVFVESAEMLKALRSSRSTRALVDGGFLYRNGTGNIYPTPAQAKRIAKQYPGTALALQCELGGYTAWRNSLRKRTDPVADAKVA